MCRSLILCTIFLSFFLSGSFTNFAQAEKLTLACNNWGPLVDPKLPGKDFYQNEIGFFTSKKSDFSWSEITDLKNKKIGTLAASAYGKHLKDANIPFIEYSNPDIGIKMLSGKRFEAMYAAKASSHYLLSTKHPKALNIQVL